MKSRISFSGMGAKNTAKTQPLSLFLQKIKIKILDPTARGKPSDIAHNLIIQVSKLLVLRSRVGVTTFPVTNQEYQANLTPPFLQANHCDLFSKKDSDSLHKWCAGGSPVIPIRYFAINWVSRTDTCIHTFFRNSSDTPRQGFYLLGYPAHHKNPF